MTSRLSDDDKESNNNDKGCDIVFSNENKDANEDEREGDTKALLSRVRELEDNKDLHSRISMLESELPSRRRVEDYIEEEEQNINDNEEQDKQEIHDMLYDTKTIHMYAVAAAVKTEIHGALPWLFVFTSFFMFVATQSAVLYYSTYEVINPSCSSHSDCRVGGYCDFNVAEFYSATCADCGHVNRDDWLSNTCPSILNATETEDNIDHTVLWFDRSYNANFNISKYGEQDDEGFWCLAWHHCKQTEMYQSVNEKDTICDYVSLVANKFTNTRKTIYVIAIIILTFHLSKDIEEAAVEEAILNYHLVSKNENEVSSSKYLPAFLLRLSLRYRRNVLPWMVAIAIIGISLADDLSVLNIMLNVLAIIFILDADSTVAYLVLSPGCKKKYYSPKQIVQDANKAKIKFSFWGTRLTAVFPAIAIILSVFWIEKCIEYWYEHSYWDEAGCEGLHSHLWKIGVVYGPFITGVIHSFCILYEEILQLRSEWKKDTQSFHEMFQPHIFWRNLKLTRFVIIQLVFESANNLFVWACNALLMDFVDLTVWKAWIWDLWLREFITYGILTIIFLMVILTLLICSKKQTQLLNHNRRIKCSEENTENEAAC